MKTPPNFAECHDTRGLQPIRTGYVLYRRATRALAAALRPFATRVRRLCWQPGRYRAQTTAWLSHAGAPLQTTQLFWSFAASAPTSPLCEGAIRAAVPAASAHALFNG